MRGGVGHGDSPGDGIGGATGRADATTTASHPSAPEPAAARASPRPARPRSAQMGILAPPPRCPSGHLPSFTASPQTTQRSSISEALSPAASRSWTPPLSELNLRMLPPRGRRKSVLLPPSLGRAMAFCLRPLRGQQRGGEEG